MGENECFLIYREGDSTARIDLELGARYVQDFETLRVWDRDRTIVLNPRDLVVLCVRNQGPVGK